MPSTDTQIMHDKCHGQFCDAQRVGRDVFSLDALISMLARRRGR